jgi:hypothetical protein
VSAHERIGSRLARLAVTVQNNSTLTEVAEELLNVAQYVSDHTEPSGEPITPAEELAGVAARLDHYADELGRTASVDTDVDGIAALAGVVRRLALRVAEDDERAGRHARIVALARLAVDGNERDLARLIAAEQVRR